MDHQRLLLDHLDLIARIVRTTGRRRHLSATEREDLASFVHLRLLENDYAILRKFQNRSSLWTYLAMVIERLSLDFCAEKWGRWRPSVMAERLGSVAVNLERLVHRDNHTIDEAIEIVRAGPGEGLTDAELRSILEQLPVRRHSAPTRVGEDAAAALANADSSESRVEDAERQARIERLQQTLRTAFREIAVQDRVVIGLRFNQEMSMLEISKVMQSSVPTLHRRLARSLKHLRSALLQAGFNPRDVPHLIGHPSIALSPLLRAEVERLLGPGRLSKRDG